MHPSEFALVINPELAESRDRQWMPMEVEEILTEPPKNV